MKVQEILESTDNSSVRAFAERVKNELGLRSFDVALNHRGHLHLMMFEVNKDERSEGKGTEAMQRLVRFADQHGLLITLSVGQRDDKHGTTSRGRLVKFYKRFGFVENTGRHKDFALPAGMYRNPR